MPLPKNIPDNIEGLSLPEKIDENVYKNAGAELRVIDWQGLIPWSADIALITYDAYIKYQSDLDDKYYKYGAVILGINGGASSAPVVGWLGMNLFDELEERGRIVPINVLFDRSEPGAPFKYGTRFYGPPTIGKFLRQRFFPQNMEGFLV